MKDEVFAQLNVFLGRLHIGSSLGFDYSIAVPTGRFPVIVQRNNGVIGRATVVFDALDADKSFAEEMFEPLEYVAISGTLLIAGEAACSLVNDPASLDEGSTELDPTGANVVGIQLPSSGSAEVGWWYGADSDAEDEGITAFDIIWDGSLDPISPDAPVRNMATQIQAFFNEHGPPSLRSSETE